MTKNKMVEMVNGDNKLLALFTGMLLDGVLIIALVVYIGVRFVS